MPDWFYRTVGRPTLFRFPDRVSRGLALGTIGALGRNRLGRGLIQFLGHMLPDPSLAFEKRGVRFASPMGIGWRVDPEMRASRGLSCFGVGCIERLASKGRSCVRARYDVLEDRPGEEVNPGSPGEALPIEGLERCFEDGGEEFALLSNGEKLQVIGIQDAFSSRSDCPGIFLQFGERLESGGWRVQARFTERELDCVKQIRAKLPGDALLIVSGGVADPSDALELRAAGADLILLDAGFVFRGPGLVKRCNAAMCRDSQGPIHDEKPVPVQNRSWLWALGLGLAMLIGGVAAFVLAASRVLLPYDEHYLGVSWQELREGTPLLFNFMAHDRGTLAGTMLGLGAFYGMVAWYGIRRYVHGAKSALVSSAVVGFASFFSFFGFGYFDTLHAFVAVVLAQLAIQVIVGSEGGASRRIQSVDSENRTWRFGQWGQFTWLVHSVGLIGAGVVILIIGMGHVFVAEDLNYLCLSREEAMGLGSKLISVVAHDRATLGGMLMSAGVVSLLSVLWTFEKGASWLWWAMLWLGLPAYVLAIGVHFWVGYLDVRHLVPAFAGLGIWGAGLMFSRGYLLKR